MCYCTPAIQASFCSSCPSRMLQTIQEKDNEIVELKGKLLVNNADFVAEQSAGKLWKRRAIIMKRKLQLLEKKNEVMEAELEVLKPLYEMLKIYLAVQEFGTAANRSQAWKNLLSAHNEASRQLEDLSE